MVNNNEIHNYLCILDVCANSNFCNSLNHKKMIKHPFIQIKKKLTQSYGKSIFSGVETKTKTKNQFIKLSRKIQLLNGKIFCNA